MMINKKLGLLAAAVLTASGAQASFDANTVAFVAVNAAGDTYVADLGSASEFASAMSGGSSLSVDPSALGSYTWTIYGANQTSNVLAAPPGGAPGLTTYQDTGVITTSGSGVVPNAATPNNNALYSTGTGGDLGTVTSWLAAVSSLSAGAISNTFLASNPADASGLFTAQNSHQGTSAMQTGSSADVSTIYQSTDLNGVGGGSPDVALLSSVIFDGSSVSAVPVPAAAWLFGSALAGLTVVRRRK